MEAIKKWLSELKSEVPTFVQLCKDGLQFIAAKVRKEDVSAVKASVLDCQKKSVKMQIVIGCIVVAVLFFMIRGCWSSQMSGRIMHGDENIRTILAKQMEQQEKVRQEYIALEKKQKEASEAARKAAEVQKAVSKQKLSELEAWYRTERGKLDALKNSAYSELVKSMNGRAHKILLEKGWPQIRLDYVDGITLAEPIPVTLKDFAMAVNTALPLKKKVFGVFSSLEVAAHNPVDDEKQVEPSIVSDIKLEGKIKDIGVEIVVEYMDRITAYLDNAFATKHSSFGNDTIAKEKGLCICNRHWEGVPRWVADMNVVIENGNGNIRLDISSYDIPNLVAKQIKEEWQTLLQKHTDDFKEKYDNLKQELLLKQQEIK